VTPGSHELTVMAGPNTITDVNDRVSLTLWQMGDGVAVRAATDTPCPSGVAQKLVTDQFGLEGTGPLLLSGSASGWVTQAGTLVGVPMTIDAGDALTGQVFANNANQHLAVVPVDLVYGALPRGQHEAALIAFSNTTTDAGDTAHLGVVEWVEAADAPLLLDTNPRLQSAQAGTQQGGDPFAVTKFESNGGTVLLRVNASAWTPQAGDILGISIQVDGKPLGRAELCANPSQTHLTVVSNDLVIQGLPAGGHTVVLQGDVSTYTDVNDRVSILAMEFPAG
jgi:hypothetical protein